jgi:hypothetical protein
MYRTAVAVFWLTILMSSLGGAQTLSDRAVTARKGSAETLEFGWIAEQSCRG